MTTIAWNEAALLDQIKRALQPALSEAGTVMLETYQENISRGERTGNWYSGQPARSSARKPIEFPQEQSGVFKEQAESWVSDNGTEARVGYPDPAPYFVGLEYKPADEGGRRPLSRTAKSERIKQALKNRTDFR